MKKKISKILGLSLLISLLIAVPEVKASTFTDVPYTHQNSDAISYLQSNNIVEGYNDNTFRPDNLINRVEFLKIVLEGTDVPLDSEKSTGFTDIDTNQWYVPYLRKAKEEGWVKGYPDNTFRPLNPINKVEALKILGEVQKWDMLALAEVPEAAYKDTYRFSWYSPYVHFAKEKGLLTEEINYLEPGKEISRAYMAEIVYQSIVKQVILYEPFQTAEDIIEDVNEVETPSDFETISTTFFNKIELDEELPNTFYKNEVYIVEGTITENNNYNSIFAFFAKENGESNVFTHMIGETNGEDFRIPLVFRKAGTYQLGIIPGLSGESNIAEITVLDGIPAEGEAQNPGRPTKLQISFENDNTNTDWDPNGNNVFRIYFYQNSTVHSYLIRDKDTLNLFYKDFKNFEEGKVKWKIYGAKASSLKPLELETQWIESNTNSFDAVTHNFRLSLDDSIKYSNISEILTTNEPIFVSGTTQENIFNKGAVIKSNGLTDSFEIETDSNLLNYYGNEVIAAGSSFNFTYDPKTEGVYILEINNQGGSAVLNIPIYIGDIIPLIPDFFDLQDPFEETYELDLGAKRQELLNYINVERAVHGLSDVSLKTELNTLAQNYATDMVESMFFSHIDPDGGNPDTRRKALNIKTNVGENLAHAPSVYFAHQALMRSAIHRENILNPNWETLGLGIELDGFGDMMVVQEFSHSVWDSTDLQNFENQLLDKINNERSNNLTVNSTLVNVARDWSDKMIEENFFSFISPSGINLIDEVQNSGVTNQGKAYILKEGTLNSLFNKLILDSDILIENWRKIGIGIAQDSWSSLYITVLYTE
jgi:uncharacterized protein YkwD